MTFTRQEEKTIRTGFYASVLIKGVVSVAEIVVGILALLIPMTYVTEQIMKIPFPFITEHLGPVMHELTLVSGIFIGVYIFTRGLVKALLIVGMLKNKLWTYPTSLGVIGAFLVYQLYQIVMYHSWAIVALTVFDLVVMWFIYEEYRVLKQNAKARV